MKFDKLGLYINEIPVAGMALLNIEFEDDGKSHVVDESVPAAGTKLVYTITPVK